MKSSALLGAAAAAVNLGVANAHCYIWVSTFGHFSAKGDHRRSSKHTNLLSAFDQGVFVNGVDQGSFRGIRTPAYNGPPPRGYANSPVKDLDSIDMRCNVLGDKQVPYTIQVEPGDNLTFDW